MSDIISIIRKWDYEGEEEKLINTYAFLKKAEIKGKLNNNATMEDLERRVLRVYPSYLLYPLIHHGKTVASIKTLCDDMRKYEEGNIFAYRIFKAIEDHVIGLSGTLRGWDLFIDLNHKIREDIYLKRVVFGIYDHYLVHFLFSDENGCSVKPGRHWVLDVGGSRGESIRCIVHYSKEHLKRDCYEFVNQILVRANINPLVIP